MFATFGQSSCVYGLFAQLIYSLLAFPFGTLLRNAIPGRGWLPQIRSQSGISNLLPVPDIRRGVSEPIEAVLFVPVEHR